MLEPKLDAPIAGMALTHELGARPWQRPPQYSTIDEVIDYYITRMASEDFEKSLLQIMEMDVPLTVVANTMQLSGVMEGIHSVDTGLLATPVLIEMMMLIGDKNDVKYNSGLENETKNVPNKALISRALEELKQEMEEDDMEEDESISMEEEQEKVSLENENKEEPQELKGLMSRRNT